MPRDVFVCMCVCVSVCVRVSGGRFDWVMSHTNASMDPSLSVCMLRNRASRISILDHTHTNKEQQQHCTLYIVFRSYDEGGGVAAAETTIGRCVAASMSTRSPRLSIVLLLAASCTSSFRIASWFSKLFSVRLRTQKSAHSRRKGLPFRSVAPSFPPVEDTLASVPTLPSAAGTSAPSSGAQCESTTQRPSPPPCTVQRRTASWSVRRRYTIFASAPIMSDL